MDKINFEGRLVFDDTDLTAPDIVIKEIISQIKSETKDIIIGTIEKYDGVIENYKRAVPHQSNIFEIGALFRSSNKDKFDYVEVNIQDDLGRIGDYMKKYEFYLSTPVFDQYKYRICFFQYGVSNYPVKVVLEQSIADEINKIGKNSNFVFECHDRTEFEELIVSVIYSRKVIGVMQELIHINQIHRP